MHRNIVLLAALASSSVVAWTSTVRGQEAPYVEQKVAAPTNALELKLSTGYTQGFGMIAPGKSIPDVAGAGLGVDLDADYRATPDWSLGVQAEYQEFAKNFDEAARGLAANVGATYHAMPLLRGDPWLRLGTGYRLLWQVGANAAQPTTVLHGFELAKATIGYDFRVSQAVALAPQVGMDLDLFLWQWQNDTGSRALSSAQVGSFVFAGLGGRFDMGGESTATGARETGQR